MMQQQIIDTRPLTHPPRALATRSDARILDVVGQRWMLHVIRDVCSGYTRFNQIQANLGISRALLTLRLRELVAEGIVETTRLSGSTRRSHYVPTSKGLALYRIILLMQESEIATLNQQDY